MHSYLPTCRELFNCSPIAIGYGDYIYITLWVVTNGLTKSVKLKPWPGGHKALLAATSESFVLFCIY